MSTWPRGRQSLKELLASPQLRLGRKLGLDVFLQYLHFILRPHGQIRREKDGPEKISLFLKIIEVKDIIYDISACHIRRNVAIKWKLCTPGLKVSKILRTVSYALWLLRDAVTALL